ncbi:MAG: hypothetical protein J6S83_04330 [Lachnospiraceae bacterium]|nr:hypothetical protein [Lachnospiraceae bacterium]
MKKLILKFLAFAAALYGLLFAVFYFDLDGKFIYYIWEPLICKHYDRMKRTDNTLTPYEMKTDEAL